MVMSGVALHSVLIIVIILTSDCSSYNHHHYRLNYHHRGSGSVKSAICNRYDATRSCMLPLYLSASASASASSATIASASSSSKIKEVWKSQPQVPLKVHIFMDGTWLYYSLIKGRHGGNVEVAWKQCPVQAKYGEKWFLTHRVSWKKLPQLISDNIQRQLFNQYAHDRLVEVVKTTVFTSARADTLQGSRRSKMINELTDTNFEMFSFVTEGLAEKCVDISLAVEMLYMATVPDAYDIAVIITGDKDFIPAMQKTRMKAKRVALCSMRNSCNRDLCVNNNHIRDFDVVWIDDYLDELIVSKNPLNNSESKDASDELVTILSSILTEKGVNNQLSSRDIGRALQGYTINDGTTGTGSTNALVMLKECFHSLRSFLESHTNLFEVQIDEDNPEFMVRLIKTSLVDEDDIDDDDEEDNVVVVEEEDDEESDYELMTVVGLKAELKRRGVSASGKTRKDDLVGLIKEHISNTSPSSSISSSSIRNNIIGSGSSSTDLVTTSSGLVSNESSSSTSYDDSDDNKRFLDGLFIAALRECVVEKEEGYLSLRDAGRVLTKLHVQDKDYLSHLKRIHETLLLFLVKHNDVFVIKKLKGELTLHLV